MSHVKTVPLISSFVLSLFLVSYSSSETGVYVILPDSGASAFLDGRYANIKQSGFLKLPPGEYKLSAKWGSRIPDYRNVEITDSLVDTFSLNPKYVRFFVSPRFNLVGRINVDPFIAGCINLGIIVPGNMLSIGPMLVPGSPPDFGFSAFYYFLPISTDRFDLLVGATTAQLWVNNADSYRKFGYPNKFSLLGPSAGAAFGFNHAKATAAISLLFGTMTLLKIDIGLVFSF